MDIYSAESYVAKLLQYVEEVNEAKPNMYQKSKDRLKDLATTCNQVVRIISEILQDEALAQDDQEFNESSRSEIYGMITSMESQFNTLKDFVNYDSSDQIIHVPAKLKTSKIPSQVRKQVLSQYGRVLKQLAQCDTYTVVQDCGILLWRWFDERFFQTPRNHPDFRYNIRRIPGWIVDIVLGYSLSLSSDTCEEFVDGFNDWCDSLNSTESGDKYAVPYSIYKIRQTAELELKNCTPVVIWDILIDAGLKQLCNQTPNDLYLKEDDMYLRCGNISPTCLDDYVNYQEDSEILVRCGIVEEASK